MLAIKYNIYNRVNIGTEEHPVWHESTSEKKMPWSEAAEEIAKNEAHNGQYEIYEDGEEVKDNPTTEERVDELEEALEMLLAGVTE